MKPLSEKIEEVKSNTDLSRYPFDEFWFRRGWEEAQKLQDEKVKKLKEITRHFDGWNFASDAEEFRYEIDKIFSNPKKEKRA